MLALVTVLGCAFCFGCLVLSIGAGLYYVAEFAEERPTVMKRFILYAIYTVALLHIGTVLIDRLPVLRVFFSLGCLASSYLLIPEYPMIEYTNPMFIVDILLSFANHVQWFLFFIDDPASGQAGFWQITGFFVLMVWAVPLGILVSLVSPSSFLPTTTTATVNQKARKRQNAIKALLGQYNGKLAAWFGGGETDSYYAHNY